MYNYDTNTKANSLDRCDNLTLNKEIESIYFYTEDFAILCSSLPPFFIPDVILNFK